MDPALAQILVGAVVTVVSQYVGFLKLRKLLETKADRADHEQLSNVVDLHDRRLAVVERARG